MGHTPTLMDYSRFNYVAQPEDNIDVADLVPGIGPYDKWATMWGYKPIPGARTADEEKKTLDEWARQQDTTPYLRFSTAGSAGADPGELTEAAVLVEHRKVGGRVEQRLVLVLAVQLDQLCGEFAESRGGRECPTDERSASALVRQLASDNRLLAIMLENRLDDGVRFAGPHQVS